MPYSAPNGQRLRQGDILGEVRAFELTAFVDGQPTGPLREYSHAIVVTQDCDLEQDYDTRFSRVKRSNTGDKLLFSVILCGVYEEDAAKAGRHREGAATYSRVEWKQIVQNKQPRYQFLGYVPEVGKKLVADFKDFFFVPCSYLYDSIATGSTRRLSSMKEPWRDQVLQRFAFFLMRIGLPTDFHELEGPGEMKPPDSVA